MNYNEEILKEVIRQVFISHRQQKGLSQENLSLIANTTRQFISMVESGKRNPSISSIGNFATAVGMSLTELFQEVDRLYVIWEAKLENPTNMAAEPPTGAQTYTKNTRPPKDKDRP